MEDAEAAMDLYQKFKKSPSVFSPPAYQVRILIEDPLTLGSVIGRQGANIKALQARRRGQGSINCQSNPNKRGEGLVTITCSSSVYCKAIVEDFLGRFIMSSDDKIEVKFLVNKDVARRSAIRELKHKTRDENVYNTDDIAIVFEETKDLVMMSVEELVRRTQEKRGMDDFFQKKVFEI